MADLSKLAISTEGVEFSPRFVDGSETDIKFRVVGKNSPQYKKIEQAISQLLSDKKKFAAKASESLVDSVVACVIGWENVEYSGESLICNYDNKIKIFKDPQFKWLTDAVYDFIMEDSNFLSQAQIENVYAK